MPGERADSTKKYQICQKDGLKSMIKCCFCKSNIVGMGNSVRPLNRGANARCCDNCNRNIIIPIRFMEHMSAKRNQEAK